MSAGKMIALTIWIFVSKVMSLLFKTLSRFVIAFLQRSNNPLILRKAFDCVDHSKLWKILKEMGIPEHLTCLLRNLYAGQEATVRTGHGTTVWFQIGKGCILSVYCHPAYLTYMQCTSWETLDWKKHKLESRLPGEISITSDMQMTLPLWQKAKKNYRASWWKWKRRVKKLV